MFRIWCEWDIDQAGMLFPTEEIAIEWAKVALDNACVGMTYEEAEADGLIYTEGVDVYE